MLSSKLRCRLAVVRPVLMLTLFSCSRGQAAQHAAISITLTSSMNPSPFGQLVTFTASVQAKAGKPTGVISFKDQNTNLGTGTLNDSGQTTFSTPLLTSGTHVISASYGGDTAFVASTSAKLSQVVKRAATSITIGSSSPASQTFGQTRTFSASVFTKGPAPTAGPPTGSITFSDETGKLGGAKLDMFQQSAFSTSALTGGKHSIVALYSGDTNFEQSTSAPLIQNVTRAKSTLTLVSTQNPSALKARISFIATVVPQNANGKIQFFDGPKTLSAMPLNAGKATLSAASLATGTHAIHANYAGDGNFEPSESPTVTQVVR